MITGIVTSDNEAVLQIHVYGDYDSQLVTDAVVDTGYWGWLTLSSKQVANLGLEWKRYGISIHADGSEITANVYEGIVIWDGHPCLISIDEADIIPLVGMSLMSEYRLNLPIRIGETFSLTKL